MMRQEKTENYHLSGVIGLTLVDLSGRLFLFRSALL